MCVLPVHQQGVCTSRPTLIACKYFDKVFDDYSHVDNWEDIPTPNFDRVLQYQNFEPEVCKWAYVMGGRLCFDVGELDKWQIIPFFKGLRRVVRVP